MQGTATTQSSSFISIANASSHRHNIHANGGCKVPHDTQYPSCENTTPNPHHQGILAASSARGNISPATGACSNLHFCMCHRRVSVDYIVQAKVTRIADLCNHPIPTAGTAWCTTMSHVGMHRSAQTASNSIRSMKDCPLVL
jgi:hypothetical protein